MKKILVLTMILLMAAVGAFAQTPKVDRQGSKSAQVVYTCPMHPEVTSGKPGKCPKCGMTLVPKKNGSTAGKKDSTSMKEMKM